MLLKRLKFTKNLIRIIDVFFSTSNLYINLQSSIIALYNISGEHVSIKLNITSSLLRELQMYKFDSQKLIRAGDNYDGGYIMLYPNDVTDAISIGLGRNISWDKYLSNMGIKVFMFDHTINFFSPKSSNLIFYKKGLSNQKTKKKLLLKDIIQLCNLENSTNVILKIDIEGDEWQSLYETDINLGMFSQIIIEFHGIQEDNQVQLHVLRKLNQNFRIIHVNPNTYSKFNQSNNYLLPDTLEITFIRKDIYSRFQKKNYSHKVFSNDYRLPAISNAFFRIEV